MDDFLLINNENQFISVVKAYLQLGYIAHMLMLQELYYLNEKIQAFPSKQI